MTVETASIGPVLAHTIMRTLKHEFAEAVFWRVIFHRVQAHELAEALHTSTEAQA